MISSKKDWSSMRINKTQNCFRIGPRLRLHSLIACLALVAANGMTKIGKIDVKSACHKDGDGWLIYIWRNPGLTRLIVEVLPAIKRYDGVDGKLDCHLMKALYGCVQATKLW